MYGKAVTPPPTPPQVEERDLERGGRQKKIGRGGKLYAPAVTGDGVAFAAERLKPGVARRIEELGKMNDRREAYAAAGDGESLLALAEEYEEKRMPVMAEEVRKEAYECGGSVEGRRSKVAGRRAKGRR